MRIPPRPVPQVRPVTSSKAKGWSTALAVAILLVLLVGLAYLTALQQAATGP